MRKAALAMLVVIIAAITVMASVNVYYVRDDDGDAKLLCRGDEAYIFIGTNRRGWSGNYIWALGATLKEYFGNVVVPKVAKPAVIVLRVTPNGVTRYVADGFEAGSYTPLENDIYTFSNGILWKWTGMQFERATAQEQQRFSDAKSGDATWSETTNVLSRAENETKFKVVLAGRPMALVVRRVGSTKTIGLEMPGGRAETIWSSDEHPRRVNKHDYQRVFGT